MALSTSSNFLEVEGEAPSNSNQLAGLYMQIRGQNFSINLDDNAVIDEGEKTASGTNRAYCSPYLQYPAFTTDSNNVTTNYTVPAQSSVKIKWRIGRHDASGCPGIDFIWETTYVASQDYDDLHAWFEAYVGGRWYTFDATQAELKGGYVAIGYGRDAADVAIFNQFGPPSNLIVKQINVEQINQA